MMIASKHWRLIKLGTLAFVVCSLLMSGRLATGQMPAHFWISMSNQSTTLPLGPAEVPSIYLAPGGTQRIYIWAQPATVDNTANNFKNLRDISLDLKDLGNQPVVDIRDNFQMTETGSQ